MLIYPYKAVSRSAKALAEELGIKRIRHRNSRLVGDPSKTVINWGSSDLPREVRRCTVINSEEAVAVAAHKRKFFQAMEGTDLTPPFCTGPGAARAMSMETHTIVARHKMTGHSGEGVEMVIPGTDMPDAPLYTLYISKTEEFRVHVVAGKVVDLQRKARRRDIPDNAVNWQVRNHANGFIYARGGARDFPYTAELEACALRTIEQLGLDFGGVDIIWNEAGRRPYVLEVNTACGLEGQTAGFYAEAFRSGYQE